MKRNTYLMSKVVVAAALAAGAVGVANANMGRLDSEYKYFFSQPIDKAPSAWRKDHPSGLSAQQLQAGSASSVSSAWKIDKPALDKAPSDIQKLVQEHWRPEYTDMDKKYKIVAQLPVKDLIAAMDRWDKEVGAQRIKKF